MSRNRLPKDAAPANGLCECGGLNYTCTKCGHVNHSHTNLVDPGPGVAHPIVGGLALCEGCSAVLQYNGKTWPEITPKAWAALTDGDRELITTLAENLTRGREYEASAARVEANEPNRQFGLAVGRLGMLYLIMVVYRGLMNTSQDTAERILALEYSNTIEALLDKWDAAVPGVKAVARRQFDQVVGGTFKHFYTDDTIFEDMPK